MGVCQTGDLPIIPKYVVLDDQWEILKGPPVWETPTNTYTDTRAWLQMHMSCKLMLNNTCLLHLRKHRGKQIKILNVLCDMWFWLWFGIQKAIFFGIIGLDGTYVPCPQLPQNNGSKSQVNIANEV